MAKFRLSGTFKGKRRSAEIEADSEGDAVKKITQKFTGFIVDKVLKVTPDSSPMSPEQSSISDDIPDPIDSTVSEPESHPIGDVLVTPTTPSQPVTPAVANTNSATKFIKMCDQFIKLIRIIFWIAGALGIIAFIGAGILEGQVVSIVAGFFAALVLGLITYMLCEFHVLFLRFMRETISLLSEVRNRVNE